MHGVLHNGFEYVLLSGPDNPTHPAQVVCRVSTLVLQLVGVGGWTWIRELSWLPVVRCHVAGGWEEGEELQPKLVLPSQAVPGPQDAVLRRRPVFVLRAVRDR